MADPRRSRALQYSTARMELGRSSSAAPGRAKPFQRPLPRRRERGAARKLLLQQRRKLRRQQRSRRSQQGLRIAALAAEAQRLRAAEAVEQLHAAVRKALCRAERIARRQLEHQRRPAANGSLGRDAAGMTAGSPRWT